MIQHILEDGVYFVPWDTKFMTKGFATYKTDKDFNITSLYIPQDTDYGVEDTPFEEVLNRNGFYGEDEIWVGHAYKTGHLVVVNQEPILIKSYGSGFNYGSTNIIPVSEEGFVIVLAEYD